MPILRRHLALCLSAAFLAAALPAAAQQAHGQRPTAEQADNGASEDRAEGILGMLPPDQTTEHALKTADGKQLRYKATAGTLTLFAGNGEPSAKIFYTAYVAEDGDKDRPLTFAFNGGPGAGSAYVHLGLVGPKILQFGKDGHDGTRPDLVDNPDSWLGFTDLVLIDPVGTGWSRAASPDGAKAFWGVDADAESLAKAIALYTQKNDRLASPKYLLGESYGGFRAAKVGIALKKSQGILPSGIVMVSPLIDGRFLPEGGLDPIQAAVQLPSLAAAHDERQGKFSPEKVAEAEKFAMGDYLVSLAGPAPSGEAAKALYGRVADMTGLPEQTVEEARGFVGDAYTKQAPGPGLVASMYDAGLVVPDAYPEFSGDHNDDPILDGFTRAYGAAFASYARKDLNYDCQMTYSLLNTEVNRKWDWDGSRQDADASGDLRDLLSAIPSFRLAVFHGYSDILTPFGATRYVLDHLPAKLAEGRTELKLYRGGHMFYTNPQSRHAAAEDARAFFTAQTLN